MDFQLDSLLNLPDVTVIKRLSLDEFSKKKGKRKFATVVTDIDKGSLELKGLRNRSLLLKNACDLTEKEEADVRNLLNKSPCLNIAYELKEELRNIYETSTTIKMGFSKIKKWLSSAKFLFGSTADTLEKHIEEKLLACLFK